MWKSVFLGSQHVSEDYVAHIVFSQLTSVIWFGKSIWAILIIERKPGNQPLTC